MRIKAIGFFRAPRRVSLVFLATMLLSLCSCSRPAEESTPVASSTPDAAEPLQINRKFDDPSQLITSSVSQVTIQPDEPVTVPVTIKNISRNAWSSAGTYPIHISYYWTIGTKRLPDEGVRTKLPGVLQPGDSASVDLIVAPPTQGKKLTLIITALQEGNAWFDGVGGQPLKLPAQVASKN